MFNINVRASLVGKMITGAVLGSVISFSVAFMVLLDRVFGALNTASNFFGSANVLMYLTIEGMFLIVVLAGAAFVLRNGKS
jgi:hypothetical protein